MAVRRPCRRQKRASNSSVAMHKYTVYKALAGSRRVVSDVADPRITARGPAVLRPIYIGAESLVKVQWTCLQGCAR